MVGTFREAINILDKFREGIALQYGFEDPRCAILKQVSEEMQRAEAAELAAIARMDPTVILSEEE